MPIRNQFLRNAVSVRKRLEVVFVCNREDKRYYIQSAFAIPDSEKMEQEQKHSGFLQKIIVVKDRIKRWYNENGVLIMGLEDFLLMPNSLDL